MGMRRKLVRLGAQVLPAVAVLVADGCGLAGPDLGRGEGYLIEPTVRTVEADTTLWLHGPNDASWGDGPSLSIGPDRATLLQYRASLIQDAVGTSDVVG